MSHCHTLLHFSHWSEISIQTDFTHIEVWHFPFHLIFSDMILRSWWLLDSLTTPKCNEAVTWIIFPDTIPISLNQMAKFRSLSNGIEGLLLVDNYRHLQPVGNRKVFVRSVSSRFLMLDKMQNENEDDEDDPDSIWFYNSHRWTSKIILTLNFK